MDLLEVIEGKGPAPSLVVSLVRGLPDNSVTKGLITGGEKYVGWGQDRHMLADLIDTLNQNTRATGQFKSPPKIKPYPRPKAKPEPVAGKGRKKVSVRDLYEKFSGAASNHRSKE